MAAFGGQTPTIIVLKEGKIIPLFAAASFTNLLQAPMRPKAKAKSSRTSTHVWQFKTP
jgi:hypothetical protein